MEFGRMNRIPPMLSPFRWTSPALLIMNDWDEFRGVEKTWSERAEFDEGHQGRKEHSRRRRGIPNKPGKCAGTDATKNEGRSGRPRRCDK